MFRRILILAVVVHQSTAAVAMAATDQKNFPPDAVLTTESGLDVRASVIANGHDVALSSGPQRKSVPLGLPRSGIVSEIRIGRWLGRGMVMAVEMRDAQSMEFRYFWVTALGGWAEGQFGPPNMGCFLNTKTDYDLVGVVNTQSDSICITLLRHSRDNVADRLEGYVYVNNCPVGTAVKGTLHSFVAVPQAADVSPP